MMTPMAPAASALTTLIRGLVLSARKYSNQAKQFLEIFFLTLKKIERDVFAMKVGIFFFAIVNFKKTLQSIFVTISRSDV